MFEDTCENIHENNIWAGYIDLRFKGKALAMTLH